MNAPVNRLTKNEIVWLANHTCAAHRHSYLTHYTCYLKEQPATTRRGFLDIEASNLQSDFGIILSWAIKAEDGRVYSDVLKPADIKRERAGQEDRRIVASLVQCLTDNFDHVVTYYGSRFDLPFIRSRAVEMNVDFPGYGLIKHTDLYFLIRNKFGTLSSRRLENACRVLLGSTDKTRVDAKYWRGGVRGEQASLAYILDHNVKDVKDLERLYKKVIAYAKRNDVSI